MMWFWQRTMLVLSKISPGVEYQDIHLLAARIMAEGLVDLGILRGKC